MVVETRRKSAQVNRRATNEGDRQLRRSATYTGEEMREFRLRLGVSQAAVARAIGVSRSAICELEQGDPTISPLTRARAAAVLGATFKFAVYPDGTPLIHDAAHARIVERLLAIRNRRWRATVEAPIPGLGRRSADLRLDHGRDIVLFEIETRIRRLEEIVREQHEKRAAVHDEGTSADRPVHVVLVLPPTRHHRTLVGAHPETIRTAYPTRSASLRAALEASTGDWPGDGLLWLAERGAGSGPAR